MGKENDKLLDRKLDDSSLEQVSGGGGGTSNDSTQCPRCKKSHQFKRIGPARVSYKNKWTDAIQYSCDNVASAFSVFYKVDVSGDTVWLDVNFGVIG
ncbi:MAG: hypothetical protein IK054_06225 [Lachnospiraceae bacterium]|nr:hypothetical protein [Lachnospiraceae bacterium]